MATSVTAKVRATTAYYGYNEADELCWSGGTDGTRMSQACPSTPSGDTGYSSDAAGNNTGASNAPSVYNVANQVTSLTPQGGGSAVTASYTDQGNDLRATARTVAAGTRFYTRDPQGHVVDKHGAGGTAFYCSDDQNSTVALLDTSGSAVTTFSYAPYGDTSTTRGGTVTTPFRWTGAYQDIEGDHYYHLGARYCDQAGHFTQPDSVQGSVADPKTLNIYIYTYAGGDPINNTDPTATAF